VASRSEGAVVVFFEDVPSLKDHPFLIEKSDGAALYATTDLATLRYRKDEFKPDEVLYVTDGRQQLHFQQLFATARKWGIGLGLEHVWFGAILGQDRKPLKTRDGAQIKLRELLDEAEERALLILKEKRQDLPEARAGEMARIIGLGALKYADLAQNRNLDYVFDWSKLLAFDGNTAPYLLNAYVRTRSILRKAGVPSAAEVILDLQLEQERELALLVLDFNSALELAIRESRPHHLCAYLYELAAQFHRFFEHCPVLKAETEGLKQSRLALARLTGDTLKAGLELLGIETLEEM
jgi:arginyl-tRNA synthetase